MEKRPRATTGRDSDKYILRFVEGLSEQIREAAKANGRSINAEINMRLTASFESKSNDAELLKTKVEVIVERNKAMQVQLALLRVANLIDPKALENVDPQVAEIIRVTRAAAKSIIRDTTHTMLADIHKSVDAYNEALRTGQVEVKLEDGTVLPPGSVRLLGKDEARSATTVLVGNIGRHSDPRPLQKIRAAGEPKIAPQAPKGPAKRGAQKP